MDLLPLTREQELDWRLLLYGSAGVPGGGPNEALLGPIVGLRQLFREGLAKIGELTRLPPAAIQSGDIDDAWTKIPAGFRAVAADLIVQSALSLPEYGGNINQKGWRMIPFLGDTAPLGFTPFDERAGQYNTRPGEPFSQRDTRPDPDPIDAEIRLQLEGAVAAIGGRKFCGPSGATAAALLFRPQGGRRPETTGAREPKASTRRLPELRSVRAPSALRPRSVARYQEGVACFPMATSAMRLRREEALRRLLPSAALLLTYSVPCQEGCSLRMLDAEIGVSNSVIGNTISHYKVVRLLGRGGMGEVYEAVDEALSRHVAIKVLLPQYAAEADVVVRFFNEARSVNLISHPGLVQVFEFGKLPDGGAFLVMEYIAGVTLRDRLKESGLLPEIEALQIALQLSSALAAAHAKDIVHRDLKPGNVMLVPDAVLPTGQRVKLLDFGIAKLGTQSATGDQPRTRTGLAIGTPTYMSPEQCRGAKSLNGKADVYSLGIMLYQMLAGRLPFEVESEGEMLGMQMYEEPPPLLSVAPHVSRSVAALVHRMLRKRAEDRPSAPEVAEVLTEMAAAVLPASARPSTKLQIVASSSGVLPVPAAVPQASTLGGSVGQRLRSRPMRLRHWLLGLTERVPWLAAHSSPRQRLIGLGAAALLISFALGFAGISLLNRAAEPATAVQATRTVRWSLSSTPAGAQILRKDDQAILGQTPWVREQPASAGTLAVVLRLKGFKDRELLLDQGHDVQLSEALEASPEPEALAGAEAPEKGGRRSGKSGSPAQKDGGSRRGRHDKRTKLID
ncbi:MAG: serine/threonine-protein kinase [Polyangia bacterium]